VLRSKAFSSAVSDDGRRGAVSLMGRVVEITLSGGVRVMQRRKRISIRAFHLRMMFSLEASRLARSSTKQSAAGERTSCRSSRLGVAVYDGREGMSGGLAGTKERRSR